MGNVNGIVRRIDDLGRVVIPKEIRRVLKLREGDPMEMWVDNGDLRLRKLQEVRHIHNINEWAQGVAGLLKCMVLVVDRSAEIITACTEHVREIKHYVGFDINDRVWRMIENGGDSKSASMAPYDFMPTRDLTLGVYGHIVVPLQDSRKTDILGGVVAFSTEMDFGNAMDLRAIQTLATIIEREIDRE